MTTDIDNAAGSVIDLTNKAGAAAVDVQHAAQAIRTARQTATIAARHPERLAAVGCGLLIVAGVLALRRDSRSTAPPPSPS
jgi:hypothetical protein